ncbi:MAG TPA: hypothetical protein VGL13_07055, partial [Polyangiaceae bacterium]|jgi:hypothetical protein
MTDSEGAFTLSGLNSGNVNVSIAIDGYAPGYANAKAGDSADAMVVSMKRQGSQQSYSAGASQTLSEKTEVGPYALMLSPDSLDTTDTDLQVAITPLDPTKERDALPGNLVSGGTDPTLLLPVTFAEFSIVDSTGKRVNLKSSASAQVELPIPAALRADYPPATKIHCYAYDPTTGKWEDFVEGTVQVSSVDGTTPVLAASVRHFSWYGGAPQGNNCVDVYVSVVSAVDGKPLANARVEATPGTVAYTDASGVALVRSAVGSVTSTYTAYQTGIDVDGSLTGMAGAKFIEFGKVQEDLVGLMPKPCTGDPSPTPGQANNIPGSQGTPLVVTVGRLTNLLYQATAILSAGDGTDPGSIDVILEQGVPGPDGQVIDPMAAGGAKITLTEGNGTPVPLTELAAGTGFYSVTSGLTITAGKAYTLAIDGDGDGSIDGTSTIYAIGSLTWVSPTDGATLMANNFVASWTDTGSVGGAAYAPLYEVVMTPSSGSSLIDEALYVGSDRQFTVKSALNTNQPLIAGSYTATILGFSGAFAQLSGGATLSNNIVGAGVTGAFYSISNSQADITFNLQ